MQTEDNETVPGANGTLATLLDDREYPPEEILALYRDRWHVELDIRDIKSVLNLDHMRCKSPPMIEREFYVTLLGYNLVRQVICQAVAQAKSEPSKPSRDKPKRDRIEPACLAAPDHRPLPRQISFTRELKVPGPNGTLDDISAEPVYWQGEILGKILVTGR